MSPEFARAVDPVFGYVLNLLERIERNENPTPTSEQRQIRNKLQSAGSGGLVRPEEWKVAKYALVGWIDEVLINASWQGADWWTNSCLERELLGSREAFDQFYVQAKQASALPRKDALEVFYLCVVLGFRGFYGDVTRAPDMARDMGLPADLEGWVERTADEIHIGGGLPPIDRTHEPVEGAPPLDGRFKALVSFFLLIALGSVSAFVAYLLFFKPS